MARTGISFEQVSAAADALRGEGSNPTIKAVRERLGTGSPNTIHEHLKKWREARPVAAIAAPELPAALAGALAEEIARAASAVRAEVQESLVQAQSELDELAASGQQIEAERDELIEQVSALTSERDTLAGRVVQLETALTTAQDSIEREQKSAELARIELATANVRTEQQAKTEAAQQALLQKLHEDLDALAKRAIAAEQESAVLKARLEAMAEAEIRSAKTLTDLRESAERTALAAAAQLKEQAVQHEARLKQLQVERDEARSDARDSLERAAKAEGQLQALQAVVKSEGNQGEKASSIADESKPVAKAPVKRTGAKKSG